MKYFDLKFIFFLTLLAIQITHGQTTSIKNTEEPPKADARIENAKNQINNMFVAIFNNRNFKNLADYAHSDAIKLVGGRKQYNELMKKAYELSFKDIESLTWDVNQYSNLIEVNSELFIVFSRTLDGIVFQTKIKQTGYLIGISNDNGDNWIFVNGKHFIKIYPNILDQIKIPNDKTFINGVEQ